MPLSADDLQRATKLARLSVEPDQLQEQLDAVNAVLGLISAMEPIDCSGVEPMTNPLMVPQPLAEDRVSEHDQRAHNQAMAPAVDEGFYLVPKVID